MKKGLLIILSGPSGVGKGTVRGFLMNDPLLNLVYSISCTTRGPRNGEINGKDYFFISKEDFLKKIANSEFLEYAQYCSNFYGTLKQYVENKRNEGKNVIVEIETNGAKQIIDKLDKNGEISIFINAPSFKELENRIRGRGTEDEETIKKRLVKAKEEMELAKNYDYVVTNITPTQCAEEIKQIIKNKLQ